ncbi:2-C-methyl-D-erythritol 4-phosphate cytidylyltransferase [Segetibacter aerophilus]|uniref:2-C-methyl-D-erythritol 4-phosphate cytidylyltransferase n=1 Tax=Segetibacter aerophilus TaxID=670293 RepID=A0A512BDG5_9BACT|nr:2-C-methyl-D-erythritol 4-phosphate cytidylyltransferase [Segetibacter aerophilus]GEO10000.1 2-C-methyl-D-erythritol 4-phosphate cytidylyltransferase [Segetibacter aerophilus]
MKKYAIIVAGGSGQRMGSEVPKQFLLIKGKPLLQYTLQTFLLTYDDLQIILVLPRQQFNYGEQIVKQMDAEERVQIVAGGPTRFHSVQNGLKQITEPAIVFVHDGVRCLVSVPLIQRCYQQALEKGSAIPAVVATDSIRVVEGTTHLTIDRNNIRIVQTPQTFRSDILLAAFKQEYTEAFTDEATVVEAAGNEVFLIEGEHNNLKITRPLDLFIAEKLLEEGFHRQ